MQVSVRRADPEQDGDLIRNVLARNLPAASSPERFEWLYLDNPAGRPLVWIATDANGYPLGTSAAHVRQIRIGSEITPALNLSDFAIDAKYRSVGPALKLLRATLKAVGDHYPFAYDHPSRAMQAVHKRLGGIDLGGIVRYTLPLSWKPVAQRRLGRGPVASVLGSAGDLAARFCQ